MHGENWHYLQTDFMEEVGKIMSSSFNRLSLSCLLDVLTKQLDISCFDISKMSADLEAWLEVSHQNIVILEIQGMDNILEREWIKAKRKQLGEVPW